jgi:hypothetical protein
MKFSFFTISLLFAAECSAFVSKPSFSVRTPVVLNAVELTPEPEGGEDLTALKTLEGCRVKNMGEAASVKRDDGTVYSFWITATAEGALIKELHTKVLKDASKEAKFPGFRKVRGHSSENG